MIYCWILTTEYELTYTGTSLGAFLKMHTYFSILRERDYFSLKERDYFLLLEKETISNYMQEQVRTYM